MWQKESDGSKTRRQRLRAGRNRSKRQKAKPAETTGEQSPGTVTTTSGDESLQRRVALLRAVDEARPAQPAGFALSAEDLAGLRPLQPRPRDWRSCDLFNSLIRVGYNGPVHCDLRAARPSRAQWSPRLIDGVVFGGIRGCGSAEHAVSYAQQQQLSSGLPAAYESGSQSCRFYLARGSRCVPNKSPDFARARIST